MKLKIRVIAVPAYTRRTPVVNDDDASGMDGGYYITLVESVDDQLCIAVKPTEPIIEKFEIYINFGSNPTEINKYAVGEVSESNDWNVCFTKSQRTDGNGVTQIGIWHYSVRSVYLGKLCMLLILVFNFQNLTVCPISKRTLSDSSVLSRNSLSCIVANHFLHYLSTYDTLYSVLVVRF